MRIAFFDNRIEVESPGLLLPGMTVEDMKLGVSQIRNPVIARVFKELDFIEQWGSGIPGIFRQVKEQNLPEPTIEELAGRVRVTIPLSEILPLTREQSRKKVPVHSGGTVEAQVEARVEAQVEMKILQACAKKTLSSAEIAESLGHKTLSGNLRRTLPLLRQTGLIEYTIPDKPNSRLQKYRITDKGRKIILAKMENTDGDRGR